MGGIITHVSVALAGFLFGKFIFKNYKYGLAFAFGQLVPDLIDFGLLTVARGYFDYRDIMGDSRFDFLSTLGHTWWHWIIFGFLVFLILIFFYKVKEISKKKFKEFCFILVFFLVSIDIHLLIDHFVREVYYWL